VIVESLQKDKHQRLSFSSGKDSPDRFLHENAHQAAAKGLSKTYVAVGEAAETVIFGYYTVTTTHIVVGELPDAIARKLKLPKHELPASLIARLAVSENVKGRGVGSLLLMDAMRRCALVASEVGGVAIVVDALEEPTVPFYERVGFRRFELGSLRMFIPMATVQEMLGISNVHRQVG